MACENCKLFHHLCKAACCTIVPMSVKTFADNFHLIQRPIWDLSYVSENMVTPMTENLTCIFLKDDFSCAIYKDRPEVCKKYGDETHILMTCEYQTKDGNARSNSERKKISKKQKEIQKQRHNE